MALGYVALAIVLAVALNARARWLRVAGTIITALGLSMMVLSIFLADVDGTFAAVPAGAPMIHRVTPGILNMQAAIAAIAILFLAWSAWRRPGGGWRGHCHYATTPLVSARRRAGFTG